MPKTATSPKVTSLIDSPTAYWERLTATSQKKPAFDSTAISASVVDPTGSTGPQTTSSAVTSIELISAGANKVVFCSKTKRWMTDCSVLQDTEKPKNRQRHDHLQRRKELCTRIIHTFNNLEKDMNRRCGCHSDRKKKQVESPQIDQYLQNPTLCSSEEVQ